MSEWTVEDIEKIYHVEKWSEGYFCIGKNGHLHAIPDLSSPNLKIDLKEVIDEMKDQNISLPAVIRFHDILRDKVVSLNENFAEIIKDAAYKGKYLGVYPIKVNQMREVVDEIASAGEEYNFGLEAGSKTELMAVLAMNSNPEALTILNGHKDEQTIQLALLGNRIGRKVFIVIESIDELDMVINVSKKTGIQPLIGVRAKLMATSGGRWASSSGERSKFGLTTSDILQAIEMLKVEGLLDSLKLLHFHIGSQISEIKYIKDAITEAARIYAKLSKLGIPMEYFDVGGGLAIDYDGSKSTKHSSKNYGIREYIRDVVYSLMQICDIEEVPHPVIVSESGRAITAHHSCIITNVLGEIQTHKNNPRPDLSGSEHVIIKNMYDTLNELQLGNIQESYNDATEYKGQALNAFNLGILSLDERSKAENLYWAIVEKIIHIMNENDEAFIPKEMLKLKNGTISQYLCNFSVFQSTADSWAINQLLPIVPITRLNEEPTKNCTIADITCDSDGKIDHFIGPKNTKESLLLHDLKKGEDYYLGIFLTGAYQDVMGDNHNLYGRLNEVHVYVEEEDPSNFYIEESIKGTSAKKILSTMQYNAEHMAHVVKKKIDKMVRAKKIPSREGVQLTDFYEDCLESYTYLKSSN